MAQAVCSASLCAHIAETINDTVTQVPVKTIHAPCAESMNGLLLGRIVMHINSAFAAYICTCSQGWVTTPLSVSI